MPRETFPLLVPLCYEMTQGISFLLYNDIIKLIIISSYLMVTYIIFIIYIFV